MSLVLIAHPCLLSGTLINTRSNKKTDYVNFTLMCPQKDRGTVSISSKSRYALQRTQLQARLFFGINI